MNWQHFFREHTHAKHTYLGLNPYAPGEQALSWVDLPGSNTIALTNWNGFERLVQDYLALLEQLSLELFLKN